MEVGTARNRAAFLNTMSSHNSNNPYDNADMYPVEDSSTTPFPSAFPTRLRNLTSGFAAPVIKLTNQKRCSLPPGYIPGDRDVICGRGKKNWGHSGNVHFRNVIRRNLPRYLDAPAKNDKTMVVISIVDEIRAEGGRFLKDDIYGRWYDIGDAQARDKVGHSLRDQVTAVNRQNNANPSSKPKKGVKRSKSENDAESEDFMVDDIVDQVMNNASFSFEEAAAASSLPIHLERRGSFHSDTGNEIEARRHSLFSSSLVHSFTRRPSLLAFSFGSRDSTRNRASKLVGGDVKASMNLESFRRSSNWDFLASLDDMDIDMMGDDNDDIVDLEHIELDNLNGSLYNFRESDVRSFAQV